MRILVSGLLVGCLFLQGDVVLRGTVGIPEQPINLSVKGEFKGAVAVAGLKWQDQSENELGFEVLRAGDGEEYKVVGFVGANTVRYQDKIGRYVSGSFVYKVRAYNEEGKSPESNAAAVWF